MRRAIGVGFGLLALVPGALAGQTARDTVCAAVLRARAPEVRVLSEGGCLQLAAFVLDRLTEGFYEAAADEAVAPRDLQSTASGPAATGGSLAQSEAVPSVQPVSLAGGAIAAVGSNAGADAIMALALNPAAFLVDLESKEAIARYTRLTDVTVFFPVDDLDRDQDGRVDYFGVRTRINMSAVSQGSKVMREARAVFGDVMRQEMHDLERLEQLLVAAPVLADCVESLTAERVGVARVRRACGAGFQLTVEDAQYERLRRVVAEAREKADAQYLGLDLRLDFGDPTLGAVPGAAATSINGGLAFGKQFLGAAADGPSAGLKARVGVRYVSLWDTTATNFAVDGGVAFEATRPVETERIQLSGGFEFRFGKSDRLEDRLQTDFLVFRAALNVPLAGATGVSIAVGAPIVGEVSPTLSVKANWELLLPGR